MSEQKTSPWVWIGCGCAGLVVLGLVAAGGLAFLGVKTAREFSDPEIMGQRGLSLLGADRLPEGYEVEIAMDLPMSIEMVVLESTDRQVVYTRGIGSSKRLDDFASGRLDLADLLEDVGVRLGSGEILATDRETFGALTADWIVYRGEVDLDQNRGRAHGSVDFDLGSADGDVDGLVSVAVLRCPDDRKVRLAIWRGPDPDPEAASDALDLTGTTGDPVAVRELLGGFRLCD